MDDFLTFLRINPYPHYLGVAFNADMRNAIIKEAGFEPREVPDNRQYGAVTEFFRDGTHAAAMCIVTFYGDVEPAPWTMAHEAVHVADDVFLRCGIENTDEPYAYLIEWIVRMMVFARDAHKNTPHSDRGFCVTDQIRHRLRLAHNERSEELNDPIAFGEGFVPTKVEPVKPMAETFKDAIKEGVTKAKGVQEGVEHGYLVQLPDELHPDARKLVLNIAREMSAKLLHAQNKYGWTNSWRDQKFTPAMWTEETIRHIQKGDPLDVINYMAFAKDRKWSADLLVDGFSAMFVKLDNDKLVVEHLNKADMLLDAAKHEDNIDPEAHANRQYETACVKAALASDTDTENYNYPHATPLNVEPCCPQCNAGTVRYTSKLKPRFYCTNCGAEFDKYGLR